MRTSYPIALKFGTQKGGGIKAHLCTNFVWNTINRQRVVRDYSRKITPICCHAYRVNRVWEEAENRWMNRLTVEPQTFCGLKEIELKPRKIQRKNQQCVTIMQSRLANKKTTACHAYQINCLGYCFENRCTDGVIILERLVNGVEESDLKPWSYNTKSNLVQQVRDRDTLIEQSS